MLGAGVTGDTIWASAGQRWKRTVDNLGRRSGQKCSVGGAAEEGLMAAPKVREAGIQEVPGPGPPCPSHPTLKLKLNVKFPDIPLFQMQPL